VCPWRLGVVLRAFLPTIPALLVPMAMCLTPSGDSNREYVLTWEIVEHDPPSRQTIESTSGPFATTLAYQLSAQDGGTLVAFSVTGRPTGMLRLLQPLIARNTQRNLDRAFPRLKHVLESGAAPSPR
jgi:hypothetical protein